ncbi:hypothetical protein TCAP_07438 [Tolypocladium capitatum]|uniref:Uncharacterized protein n=1 Tax=Tolypocladium capitatum TaxID=45235 RepID=A0A2K3PXE8_9HYPO|nr:hypothetical protein TCAP_07438 [Tolypocladium capitatum]
MESSSLTTDDHSREPSAGIVMRLMRRRKGSLLRTLNGVSEQRRLRGAYRLVRRSSRGVDCPQTRGDCATRDKKVQRGSRMHRGGRVAAPGDLNKGAGRRGAVCAAQGGHDGLVDGAR